MATYHWLRVRAADRTRTESYERLQREGLSGAEIWGAFYGLFGLGSNELVLVLYGENAPLEAVINAGFEVVESHALLPTVRPEEFEPLTRPGLYIFRFLDVANQDIDEIAELSDRAWASFENTAAYTTKPQGLFRQADRSAPRGVMLLLTWYDGFESWQGSRNSAPEAREFFRRRRALTNGTIAFATRLVGT